MLTFSQREEVSPKATDEGWGLSEMTDLSPGALPRTWPRPSGERVLNVDARFSRVYKPPPRARRSRTGGLDPFQL